MAFFTGVNGSLELEGTKIAAVQNWSFTINVQTADTSTLGQQIQRSFQSKEQRLEVSILLPTVLGVKSATDSASRFINKIGIQCRGRLERL